MICWDLRVVNNWVNCKRPFIHRRLAEPNGTARFLVNVQLTAEQLLILITQEAFLIYSFLWRKSFVGIGFYLNHLSSVLFRYGISRTISNINVLDVDLCSLSCWKTAYDRQSIKNLTKKYFERLLTVEDVPEIVKKIKFNNTSSDFDVQSNP